MDVHHDFAENVGLDFGPHDVGVELLPVGRQLADLFQRGPPHAHRRDGTERFTAKHWNAGLHRVGETLRFHERPQPDVIHKPSKAIQLLWYVLPPFGKKIICMHCTIGYFDDDIASCNQL